MGRRLRLVAGLLVLAEVLVFVLVAAWIGLGWTILAALATSALGWVLLARQGTRALTELRERARTRRAPAASSATPGWSPSAGCSWCCRASSATSSGCCACCRAPGASCGPFWPGVVLAPAARRVRGPVRVEQRPRRRR